MIAYKRIAILYLLIIILSIFIATQMNSILNGLLVLAFLYLLFIGLPYLLQKKVKFFEMFWNWLTKGERIGPKN
ncbi:putative membrane-anchored protein [Lysinibacillus sp. RC46]